MKARYISLVAFLAFSLLGCADDANPNVGNLVGLLVKTGSAETHECFDIGEQEAITAIDLLRCSSYMLGLTEFEGFGSAICKIDDTGCESDHCFCDMKSWLGYTSQDDTWLAAEEGIDTLQLADGDVYSWSWTLFDTPELPEPADIHAICSDAQIIDCTRMQEQK